MRFCVSKNPFSKKKPFERTAFFLLLFSIMTMKKIKPQLYRKKGEF